MAEKKGLRSPSRWPLMATETVSAVLSAGSRCECMNSYECSVRAILGDQSTLESGQKEVHSFPDHDVEARKVFPSR